MSEHLITRPDTQFVEWPKISRWSRQVVVTEKLDGTNACVHITEQGTIHAGSRTRWITPEEDNYGFAAWVKRHADELLKMGPGSHFGEWWGSGIQRRYGQTQKVFSLFNTGRWAGSPDLPTCCKVVPVLYEGMLDNLDIVTVMQKLREFGSVAAPGFMDPEGVVIYHTKAQVMFKKTFTKDEQGKGE